MDVNLVERVGPARAGFAAAYPVESEHPYL